MEKNRGRIQGYEVSKRWVPWFWVRVCTPQWDLSTHTLMEKRPCVPYRDICFRRQWLLEEHGWKHWAFCCEFPPFWITETSVQTHAGLRIYKMVGKLSFDFWYTQDHLASKRGGGRGGEIATMVVPIYHLTLRLRTKRGPFCIASYFSVHTKVLVLKALLMTCYIEN